MHGFLGCVETDVNRADAMSRWMKAWIDVEPRKEALELRRPPFLFLVSAEPGAPEGFTASDGSGLVVAYSGFIARDQLKDDEHGQAATDAEVAEALLRLYRAEGADALAALNGRYVAAVWDPQRKSLELMNDILGLKPVFLWHRDDSFAFSSNVWAIVCHAKFCKGIDRRGLVDLLLLSHQQANRTLHQDVSVLAPGSVMTLRDGKVTSRVVRNLEFSQERWDWGVDKVADGMYELLSQSVRRRVPDGATLRLPLSGGIDSRTVLDLLLERPVEIHAFTQYQYGAYGLDARYARKLARRARIEHRAGPLPDDFLARYREKCVAINGGLYDIHTGRYLSLSDQSRREATAIISGHLGGELTGRFQVSDTAFCTPQERYELVFKEINMFRFDAGRLRSMLAGGMPKGLVDQALEECSQFYLSHDGVHFQQGLNWDLLLYRRRFISFQLLYLEQFCRTFTPFYDRDFVDFVCSVPFSALEAQRAYQAMHCRHFPSLARIPNSNTGTPMLTSTRFVLADFIQSQYGRFVRRPLNRLLHLRRWVGNPCLQLGFALMGSSRSVLDNIVQNMDALSPYLDPQRVQEAVDRQLAGDSSCSMGLLALSTFATTLSMLDDPHMAVRVWQDDSGGGRSEG